MPSLDKIPKDAVFLTANDKDDFLKWQDIWTKNGWLIAADYQDGFYSCIALKDSTVLLLGFREAAAPAPVSQEEKEGIAAEEAAIEQLTQSTN